MITRRAALLLTVLLLLVPAGLAGCGDDGDDGDAASTTTADDGGTDGSTTEADGGSTTTDGSEGSTTEAPGDDPTTTVEGSTTSPNLPPNDSPLGELLLDPADIGSGYAADDALGDGSFDTDLCEEVTLEQTWDDQAAQALLAGEGPDSSAFQQSVLGFPDAATAEAFVTAVSDALVTCQTGTEAEAVDGVGDQALIARAGDSTTAAVAGMVRVGDRVSWLLSIAAPDQTPVVDEALLAAAAEQLAG
jgi:hypothetical protein